VPAAEAVAPEPLASQPTVTAPLAAVPAPAADVVVERPEAAPAAAAEPAVAEGLLATDDAGEVAMPQGTMRMAQGFRPEVVDGAEAIEVRVRGGWTWTSLPADAARPVVIDLPVGTLTIPADTIALAVAEADDTSFVVVVSGEAMLVHASGRMRLRAGAMALAPAGSDPQVDVASAPEIDADPLVARNRALDQRR
jgi:hypothetical protein